MAQKLAGLGFLVLTFATVQALAYPYPARPIRVIAAQSAGSSLDTVTRIVTNKMSDMLGQQLVIDNRGGIIGLEIGARAAPDGYTLVVGASSSMIISSFSYRKLAFDTLRDFDPISLIVNAEGVMAVHLGVPAKNVKELIELAKSRPGKLNMASAGVASSSHLAGVLFTSMAGINTVHVPYKGGGASAAAIVAGEAHWYISPAAGLVGHIKAGRMRALAISSKTRSPLLPNLPTIDEAGVPGYEYTSWSGFFAPKGTPHAIVKSVHAIMQKALGEPDVKQQFANQGLLPLGSVSPEEFGNFVRADYDRIAKLVKIAGIKPE